MKSILRDRLSDLKFIITDEISMVSNNLLFYVHKGLHEHFGSVMQEPFARLAVIAVGDFFQLPPVGDRPMHSPYKNTIRIFDPFWKRFRPFALTEVM